MKILKLAIVAVAFYLTLPFTQAHAAFFNSYAQFYTTGAANSTTQQSVFSWDEKPWVYIQMYDVPALYNPDSRITFSAWDDASASNYSTVTTSNENQMWVSFSDSYWNSIKTAGTWDVIGTSINPNPNIDSFYGETSFKLNAAPEPVSTVLFLIGGAIMGAGILRHRKAFNA